MDFGSNWGEGSGRKKVKGVAEGMCRFDWVLGLRDRGIRTGIRKGVDRGWGGLVKTEREAGFAILGRTEEAQKSKEAILGGANTGRYLQTGHRHSKNGIGEQVGREPVKFMNRSKLGRGVQAILVSEHDRGETKHGAGRLSAVQ